MEFDRPKEELPHFKARVKAIESRRKVAIVYLIIALPSVALAVIFLITSLIWQLRCLWNLVGIILLLVTAGSLYMWFHFKKAEEFEDERRRERIREMNGPGKCAYLEGKVPDGTGKIGKCILYDFTLDSYPYCIYCNEYRLRTKE